MFTGAERAYIIVTINGPPIVVTRSELEFLHDAKLVEIHTSKKRVDIFQALVEHADKAEDNLPPRRTNQPRLGRTSK